MSRDDWLDLTASATVWFVLMPLMVYVLFAFISWNPNPAEWGWSVRAFAGGMWFSVSAALEVAKEGGE